MKCFAEKSKDGSGDEGARATGKKPTQGQNKTRLRERERTGYSGNRDIYLVRAACIKECLVPRSVLLL